MQRFLNVGDVAKLLASEGIETGQNRLFAMLRDEGVLQDKPKNIPKQRFVENGYFKVIKQRFKKKGILNLTTKTLVTERGVEWIRKMFQREASC